MSFVRCNDDSSMKLVRLVLFRFILHYIYVFTKLFSYETGVFLVVVTLIRSRTIFFASLNQQKTSENQLNIFDRF